MSKATQIESDDFDFGALVNLLESAASLAGHSKVSQEVRDLIRQAKRETYFLAQRNLADVYQTKEQNECDECRAYVRPDDDDDVVSVPLSAITDTDTLTADSTDPLVTSGLFTPKS